VFSWTAPSPSHSLSLEQVIERLSARDGVEGILIIGSAVKSELTPASDYDLVLVLDDIPVPLHVALTTIDRRLADIIFVTRAQIDEVLGLEGPVDGDAWIGRIVRWLLAGQIAHDRSGSLVCAQAKVKKGDWLREKGEQSGYGSWFKANYNLAQTRRLFASDDPLYLAAGELRISVYGPSDLLFGYWDIRGLRWEGDKEAIRYLETHDPDYLRLFFQYLQEPDARRKLELYEDLVERTTAPMGGLWPEGATALTFDEQPVRPETIEAGLRFWEDLFHDDTP
jgi:predicted nucleotidyltransferase